jgi:hypothetical protein
MTVVLDEKEQQLEHLVRQGHRLAVAGEPAFDAIQAERTELEQLS